MAKKKAKKAMKGKKMKAKMTGSSGMKSKDSCSCC